MTVIDQLSLRRDPFGPACAATGFGVAAPLLIARDRLLAAIRRGDPLTVLAGRPGMGKTLLLNMVEQACRAEGIEVHTVARGDMAHTALGGAAELLLIDEADTINAATLTALAPGTASATAPMMVFAASQPALHRISGEVRTTIVDLRPLDPGEAREFLLARAINAGRPELFTSEALDVIIDAGRGSPRLLRVLAGSAMFQAVSDGVPQITADHAGLAAAMQGSLFGRPPAEPVLPVPANDLGARADSEDRPRAVVPPLLRPMARRRAAGLAFAASVALVALLLPVFSLPEPTEAPSMAVPSASAAGAPGSAYAAGFTMVPPAAPRTMGALAPPLAPEAAIRHAAVTVPPLLAAPAPRILVAALDAGVPAIALAEARVNVETRALARHLTEVNPGGVQRAGAADRALLIDVLAATRLRPAVASRTSGGIQESAGLRAGPVAEVRPVAPSSSGGFGMPELSAVWRAVTNASEAARTSLDAAVDPVKLADLTAQPIAALKAVAEGAQSVKASAVEAVRAAADAAKQAADEARAAKLAADQAKEAADQAKAAKDAAEQANAAKEAAEQAKAAKDAADQAKAAKDAADQAKAAKDAADQAKSAKDAADQAKASKEASDQAKAAKDAADQAKAAKDAADQAKAAKDAADQAKAAKEAADQAKAAKDAADQAKAAKDAADQAKAAKDAADQAKAAKDAADQAKAAKDAADQAKAAKDAADQAKAAKDAADQAKAAKDAADQAKAAKDAADQAKAAKDAADQAKAAKDAADQAKAAKDAADQAKAAKEAADAAKDAAKAAKDAAKAAKDAAKAGKGN